MDDTGENSDEQIPSAGAEIRGIEQRIGEVQQHILRVEEEIGKVEQRIDNVEEQIGTCSSPHEKAQLRGKEDRLRNEEAQLRDEEAQLRDEKAQLRDEKAQLRRGRGLRPADVAELPSAPNGFQRFVRSAAQKYQEWEDSGKKFLEVDGHPFGPDLSVDEFLIFIRKSYKDLKKIFMKAGPCQTYIVLGTAGIGLSLFTVFWVCYLATLKKKVVWKFASGHYYLLDFSLKVARGPVKDETHPDLRSVFDDSFSWLIIDGKQKHRLYYSCHMLLACSGKKSNYHEFSKPGNSRTYYLPVWAEAEIIEYCEDFGEHRSKFQRMHVPDMQTALANFKEVGGVPRYVLDERKMLEGKKEFRKAIEKVDSKACVEILSGQLLTDGSDMLVHMFVNEEDHMPLNKEEDPMSVDKETNYQKVELRFASSCARDGIIQQFDALGHVEVVSLLERLIDSQTCGTMLGHLYEWVAHVILHRGGTFKRKRVFEDTANDEATEDFDQGRLKCKTFKTFEDLSGLKRDEPSGAYCRPSSLNFESVDAVIVPNTLVQFFTYSKGNHGYKIHGLKKLDKALNMPNYDVWSCVPKESFETTKFQNWLNKDGTKCKFTDDESSGLVQKMKQYVVEVDFRKYEVATKSDKDK